MSASIDEAVAVDVSFDEQNLLVHVRDGRTISVPLSCFPRLASAAPAERADWRLIGVGEGIHWPGLDEDVSVSALLHAR